MDVETLNQHLEAILCNHSSATNLPANVAFILKGWGKEWVCRRNEHWVVTGPNGSGKSYLAALLADELPLCGYNLEMAPDLEESRAQVTFSQQQSAASGSWLQARWHGPGEVEDVTVKDFLSYDSVHDINPYEVVRRSPKELRNHAARLCHIAERLGLKPLLTRTVVQLSNGETRLVLLTRALLKNPRLLILDDPFAGLSPERRTVLKNFLDELAPKTTMVLMLRNADEVPSCATDELFLDQLKIVRFAKPQPLAHHTKPHQWILPPTFKSPAEKGVPVIEMDGVTIAYGKRKVIDNLHWRVLKGERWLITGPNGCGKTTLISLITGDNPAAYRSPIRIFGRARKVGECIWSIRRKIAQVSPEQQTYFNPAQTVLEAVISNHLDDYGQPLPMTRQRLQKARQNLKLLDLQSSEKRTCGSLSAGEQRLVLFARAFTAAPQMLILDEPCLNLDRETRTKVLRLLSGLLETHRDMTVLCVAHRQSYVPDGFHYRLALG